MKPRDSDTAPIPRVLHVVESLDRGAVENWLVRMLRHANASGRQVDWTFYCTLDEPGALNDEARTFGARTVSSPAALGDKVRFARALRAEVRSGRYDVLHCHHDLVSAVYLAATVGLPVARRIVHVHNADEVVPTASALKRAVLREPMREACLGLAHRVVGISNHTLDTFLAGRPRRSGRDVVHYYGVDPERFRRARADRAAFRLALGLAPDAPILLFAGRLVPEKNPLFVLDVLAQMRRLDPSVAGVVVGAGSMEAEMAERAGVLGLSSSVRFLGWRDDVAEVMSCCDWFILPRPEHPMEGFGLAVVEAQLAGLRLLLSAGIPDDPLLPSAVFRRLPLSAGPHAWAAAAMDMRGETPSRQAALEALKRSPMDMDYALADLRRLHA